MRGRVEKVVDFRRLKEEGKMFQATKGDTRVGTLEMEHAIQLRKELLGIMVCLRDQCLQ